MRFSIIFIPMHSCAKVGSFSWFSGTKQKNMPLNFAVNYKSLTFASQNSNVRIITKNKIKKWQNKKRTMKP